MRCASNNENAHVKEQGELMQEINSLNDLKGIYEAISQN